MNLKATQISHVKGGTSSNPLDEALYIVKDAPNGKPKLVRIRNYRNDHNGDGTGNFYDTSSAEIINDIADVGTRCKDQKVLALIGEVIAHNAFDDEVTKVERDNAPREPRSIEISYKGLYPANGLSNLATRLSFVFDGVRCTTMEGLLQSFKFSDPKEQWRICDMNGIMAQNAGAVGEGWKTTQQLWWRGQPFNRTSDDYKQLLIRAYQTMFEYDADFRLALLATGNAVLKHPGGKQDPAETVITEWEFCRILTDLRAKLWQER